MMDTAAKKSTGSFYTCHTIADYIAKWAIQTPQTCALEPSFGNGIFIDAALSRYAELGNQKPEVIGVEMQEAPFKQFMKNHEEVCGFQMDFMDFKTAAKINAVIGNPPYIRLGKLSAEEREKALRLVSSYGLNMQTSGSLWMPFIIHSTELLEQDGRLGFVLPYEITYVRYAFDLWKYLASNYGKITICRIYHDFFPDVDVETVVLLAEKKGAKTDTVSYEVFNTVTDLYRDNACLRSEILIEDIISLGKPFERELMSGSVASFLDSLREKGKLSAFVDDCKFKIGYVTGNKSYFHLSPENIRQYNIRTENIRKCLINAKQITANGDIGVETRRISDCGYLFYPVAPGEGEKQYISYGKALGVDKGYKCKVRKPWYMTPGLEVPDVILTVFGNTPKMLLNDGGFYVSNSLLSGFSKVKDSKELICRWYNSLTLLSVESTIHSLGGGTLVLIPGETDKLEIISDFPAEEIKSTYQKISEFAKDHSAEELYRYGDTVVLKEIYGFSEETIKDIRDSLQILRNWRDPDKRRG